VECVIASVLVLVISLAMIVIFASGVLTRSSRWNEAFSHVARQFHGAYTAGGWFSEPSVRLMYGLAQARLSCYSLGRSGKTVVQLVIEQKEVRCRCEMISRPSTVTLVPSLTGLTEVELDWGRQFARWQVAAVDYDEARHVMTDAIRLALDRIWLHPLPRDTAVSLLPGWIVIRKVWDSPRASDLAQFVELGCSLNDQVQLAAAAGIEFVAGDEAQVIDEALCCVCCERLTSEIVLCVRCKTPHHRECWEYSGGCSTYGCGGRMCFTPGEAPLANPPHWHDAPSAAKPAKPR
jgi:RING finger family protein